MKIRQLSIQNSFIELNGVMLGNFNFSLPEGVLGFAWKNGLGNIQYAKASRAVEVVEIPDWVHSILALEDVQLAVLAKRKLELASLAKNICKQKIREGVSYYDTSGTLHKIPLSSTDQANLQRSANVANFTIANTLDWAPNTTYADLSLVKDPVTSNYYVGTAGTSGETAPMFSANFVTPVTDGTVVWKLLGTQLQTSTNRIWVTTQQLVSIYAKVHDYLEGNLKKVEFDLARIDLATSLEELDNLTF